MSLHCLTLANLNYEEVNHAMQMKLEHTTEGDMKRMLVAVAGHVEVWVGFRSFVWLPSIQFIHFTDLVTYSYLP